MTVGSRGLFVDDSGKPAAGDSSRPVVIGVFPWGGQRSRVELQNRRRPTPLVPALGLCFLRRWSDYKNARSVVDIKPVGPCGARRSNIRSSRATIWALVSNGPFAKVGADAGS